MYDNVGGILKTIAKVEACIGFIASTVFGIAMTSVSRQILVGILIFFLGSFFSWIASLGLYAFGQIVENTDTLVRQTQKNDFQLSQRISSVAYQPISPTGQANQDSREHKWKCSGCGNMISDDVCPYCGKEYK